MKLDFDKSLFDNRLVIANLEGGIGISDLPVREPTNYNLFSHPEILKVSRQFNLGAVTLANNHSDDFDGGLIRTTALLDEHGTHYAGTVARPYLALERGGKRLVILAACAPITGINRSQTSSIFCFEPRDLLEQIQRLRAAESRAILVDGKYGQLAIRTKKNRKIRLSDGCGENSVLSTMVRRYDLHRPGGYLGNIGSD